VGAAGPKDLARAWQRERPNLLDGAPCPAPRHPIAATLGPHRARRPWPGPYQPGRRLLPDEAVEDEMRHPPRGSHHPLVCQLEVAAKTVAQFRGANAGGAQ